jgi:tetratricopeptide (TPR) repeat protein
VIDAMNTSERPPLLIYCDGGFGNRLNALFTGLALARALELPATVFWPRNNWCQAGFTDVFSPGPVVDERSLRTLAGTLGNCFGLFHDALGADTVGLPFVSAYDYASVDDFAARALQPQRPIFFYPALMPTWIPGEWVVAEMQRCAYQPFIRDSVVDFITTRLGRPFHGLHLRRTDLGVGYSDEEVAEVVQMHPAQLFFVCSDDPLAEALAAAHPNVVRRDKGSYVGKRHDGAAWTAATADDDGRVYHGNIDRSAASVVEAVIDLLILAHSAIVGYSGSTFQNIARLYGRHAPLLAWEQPMAIEYGAMGTWQRQLQAGVLVAGQCVELAMALAAQGEVRRAITLEKLALERWQPSASTDINVLTLQYNLAAHLLNAGQPVEAIGRLHTALEYFPDQPQLTQLLDNARQRAGLSAPARVVRTFMHWHLGDNLLHLHFLRKLSERYPQLEFVHALQPSLMAQCQEMLTDRPQIRLVPLEPGVDQGLDGWKGAEGFFFQHPNRFQFGALYIDLFARLAHRMGLESPLHIPDDLLFDYPAICRDKRLGTYDVLLVNSQPLSEQFKSYRESDFVDLAELFRARGLSVITTRKIDGYPCTLDDHLSVTDIANLSLRARYFIAVCTGAMWPSMNIFNQSIHQFRVILNDHETIDFGTRITMCRDSAKMQEMVRERLDAIGDETLS